MKAIGRYLRNAIIIGALSFGLRASAYSGAGDGGYRDAAAHRTEQVDTSAAAQEDYYIFVAGRNREKSIEDRHMENMASAYNSVLEAGADPDNVYILSDRKPWGAEDALMPYPIDGEPSESELKFLLEYVSAKAGKNDRVMLYMTDHGTVDTLIMDESFDHKDKIAYKLSCEGGECTRRSVSGEVFERLGLDEYQAGDTVMMPKFSVGNEDIYAAEIQSYVRGMEVGEGIVVSGFCYAGPYAEMLSGDEFIGVASSEVESYSDIGDSFDGFFIKCISPRDAAEKDGDGDGMVTAVEALDYSRSVHKYCKGDSVWVRKEGSSQGYEKVASMKPVIYSDGDASDFIMNDRSRTIRSFEERTEDYGKDPRKEIHALIIDNDRNWSEAPNVSRAYQMLLEHGADPEDIYILSRNGNGYSYPVDARDTRENLDRVFDALKGSVGSEDMLFVYMAGHGGTVEMKRNGSCASYTLADGSLTDFEFRNMLGQVGADKKVALFDFNGGDSFTMSVARTVDAAISSARDGDGWWFYDPRDTFGGYLMEALGTKSTRRADKNGDGETSLWEASVEALGNHEKSRTGRHKPLFKGTADMKELFIEP